MKILIIVLAMLWVAIPSSAQELSDSLQASYSIPEGRVKEIVRNAAKDFGRRHAKSYVSIAFYSRLVKSGDHYCQLRADAGLCGAINYSQEDVRFPWEDSAAGFFLPFNSLLSLFHIPGIQNYDSRFSVLNPNLKGLDYYYVNYRQYPLMSPMSKVRAMELDGPINIKKIKYYSFRIDNYQAEREIYTVSFTSKEGAFPKHVRITGEGQLFISKKFGLLGFKLVDVEDRFSSFVRLSDVKRLPSVTSCTVEVRYRMINGCLVPDHMIQQVDWTVPDDKAKKTYYFAEENPYKNPFKYHFSSFSKISFSNTKILDTETARYVSSTVTPSHAMWWPSLDELDCTSYPDPLSMMGSLLEKARIDLEADGISLEPQSRIQKSIVETVFSEDAVRDNKEKTKLSRFLFDRLFR